MGQKPTTETGAEVNQSEAKVHCSDLLECQNCGHKGRPEKSELGTGGKLWRVLLWCKICKAAAIGKTYAEAENKYKTGAYEMEAL